MYLHYFVLSPPTEFIPTLKTLLGNPLYGIYLCVTIIQFNSLIGMVTYKPKYIEQHYGQSASKANFLMGELCPLVLCYVPECAVESCVKNYF